MAPHLDALLGKGVNGSRIRCLLPVFFVVFLAFAIFKPAPTFAATCTSNDTGGGNWNAAATWSGCGGTYPGSSDDVIIANGDLVVVNIAAMASSTSFASGNASTTLSISGTNSLTVTNGVTLTAPTGNVTKTLAVGGGTLRAKSIGITSGTATRISRVTVSTGTIHVSGNVSFSGTASSARFIFSGIGNLNIGGNLGSGGTFTADGGTVNFNGSTASTAAGYTYNVFKSNNRAGVTMAAAGTITTLTIGDVTSSSVFSDGGYVITPGASSVLNLTNGTYKLGSAGTATTWPAWVTRNISANGTVEYAAGVAQAVSVTPSYQNLSYTGAGTKNVAAGTLSVAGNWAVSSTATLTTTANANVTGNITGNGNITVGSGTISVGGNWTNGGSFTAGTGTVNYNKATGGQTVAVLTYNNLTLGNTSGIQTAANNLTVNGTLTTTAGGTLNMSTYTLSGSLSGISNGGTIRTQNTSAAPLPSGKTWGGNVTFDGSSAQTSPTSTFSDLTINNAAGVTVTGDVTVDGALTLSSANPSSSKGALDVAGSRRLIMGALSTTVGSGDVTGNVFRSGPFVSGHDYSFGSQHTLINFPGSSAVTNLNVKITMGSAPSWKADAINRRYDFTLTPGAGSSTGVVALHYLDGELNGNSEDLLTVWRYNGSVSEVGRSSHSETLNLVTFGPIDISIFSGSSFSLADTAQIVSTWDGSASTDWNDDANWDTDIVPTTTTNVIIPDAATTPNDPQLPAADVEIKTIEIQSGGILNAADGYTLTLNGDNTAPYFAAWDGHGTFNPGTGTVEFINGESSFTGTGNFHNVIIGPGTTLNNRLGSTMSISGTVTNNGTWFAAYAINNTIEYTGNSQTVVQPNGPTPGYKNLIINGTGTTTLPATLNVAGNFTNNGVINTVGNTMVLNGSTDQSIGGTGALSFNNLTIGNAGYEVSANKSISVTGTLNLAASSTLDMGTSTLVSVGSVTGNGTLKTSSLSATPIPSGIVWSGPVQYISTSGGQTIVAGTYGDLTVDQGTSSASLGGDATVGGVLALISGPVSTGANTIYVNSTGSVSRTSGHVNGNLKKYVTTGATSETFEIGDATNYTPMDVAFGNVTVAGDLALKTTAGDHPNIGTSTVSSTKSVARYWSATNTGIVFDNFNAVLHFVNADKDVGADPSKFIVGKFSGGTWSYPSVGTKNGNYTQVVGLTGFSDFQIGESAVDYAALAVAADKAALVDNDIRGLNLDLAHVTTTLTNPLPSIGSASGSAITWASDATTTVSNDGQTVNRPTHSEGDATVHMTATIASSTVSDSKIFTLTVLALPASTDAKVTSGVYVVSGGSGPAETIANVPFGVSSSTFLSNLTKSESHSTWNIGGIHNPVLSGDTLVVTAEDGVTTIAYTVTTGLDPASAAVAADKAALVDNDIKGANPDLAHVTVHLTNPLPSIGSASGSAITWISDVPGTVSNDGQTINRPPYSSGDATVHMTATIASSTASDTKLFTLTVLRLPDVAPPIISGIGSTPSSAGASIHWTTDELSSTKVVYSTDLSYSSVTTETDTSPGVTSHGKSLVGLSACTAYHYKVVSRDAALNSTTSTDQTFTTTGCETGGGGGVSMAPAVGVAVNGKIVPLDFTINNGASMTDNKILNLTLNADAATVRGYAVSLDPQLSDSPLNNFSPSATFELPDVSGTYTVYLRYYSLTGQPSQTLSHSIVYKSRVGSPTQAGHFTNPSNLQKLLDELPTVCDLALSDEVLKQVLADAKEFGLTLTQDQAAAIRNFVLCGNSAATIKFGRGERRAIMRDYMETVRRSEVVWSDIERLATGQIPLTRNIVLERSQINKVLPVFRKLFGRAPNFKNETENLAWNTLLYRIRFPRDMAKESKGIKAYFALYGHNPTAPFSWAVVRVLGYVK